MERVKIRPWSAAALVGSVLWILICVYEFWIKTNTAIGIGASGFIKLEETVQTSAFGVLGLAALAWLGEQIWPPPRRF
jgi:hypothetical protein